MPQKPLTHLLNSKDSGPSKDDKSYEKKIVSLQLKMLRAQQGIWHQKSRVIILFEGFDGAGKGGAIRRIVEKLDPRGFDVHPIGPPTTEEKGEHYLQRFWKRLPRPGTISIFDRSWYGRVLVERVDKLASKKRWKAAFDEINEFEKMLIDDGISLIKIFLAIDRDEQSQRFEERISDPYKQWKLNSDDIKARSEWEKYVEAADDLLSMTDSKEAPWCLVPANHKHYARVQCLKIVTKSLGEHSEWIEKQVEAIHVRTLEADLKKVGVKKKNFKT